MEQVRVNIMKVGGLFLMILMLVMGGVSGSKVINQATVPLTIERTTQNGILETMVVGGNTTMEIPAPFSTSAITLRNQLSGGSFGPFTLRRNAVMLVQSSGLLSNAVTVLIGTIIQGVLTALNTLIGAL